MSEDEVDAQERVEDAGVESRLDLREAADRLESKSLNTSRLDGSRSTCGRMQMGSRMPAMRRMSGV